MHLNLKSNKLNGHNRGLILFAFIVPLLFWIYLFFSTNMVIAFDGLGYQTRGLIIYNHGWAEYFKTGPHKAPLFASLIAISRHLSDYLPLNFLKIQTLIHMLILAFTQILSYKLLRLLKINSLIICATILYIGLSPAIINSAFSLWAEIITYPFILIIVITSFRAWKAIYSSQHSKKVFFLAMTLGLSFFGISMVKAVFEGVFILFLLPYFLLGYHSLRSKQLFVFRKASIFLITTIILFNAPLLAYKTLNYKYNQHFALTNRGANIVYGNTIKRTHKLTFRDVAASLASIPGEGVCRKIFTKNECWRWGATAHDFYGKAKLKELQESGMPTEEIDPMLFSMARKQIRKKPLQFLFLVGIENFKMFFWESTSIGYVNYPPRLTKLFHFGPFKNGIRLIISILTIWSFLFTVSYMWKNRHFKKKISSLTDQELFILLPILSLIIAYTLLHSFVTIHTRYGLTIAPLFLIMIAFQLQKMYFTKKHNN